MISRQMPPVTPVTPGAARPWRRGSGRLLRHLRYLGIWLGGVTVLSAGARWITGTHAPPVRLLTVRPREMATGTRTARAGDQALAGFPSHLISPGALEPAEPVSVYVPARCVGTWRCPLLVNLYHGGEWRPMADKYGMIVLFVRNTNALYAPNDSGARFLDAVLKQALRQFAIDPARIALSGTCGSGGAAFFWGRSNLRVFSRIAVISPAAHWGDVTTPPQTTQAQFFIVSGIDEQSGGPAERTDLYLNGYLVNSAKFVREARRDGLRVTAALGLRDHPGRAVDYDHVGRWLIESWATSTPPSPAPVVVADPPPVLTVAALHQLTAFWQRFVGEPDSVGVVGRLTHLRRILVPIGTTRWVLWMSDLPALAARYPAVAADLKAAGLTARQAEAYRVALIGARATLEAGAEARPIAPSSVLGRNIAFYKAHPTELQVLDQTAMWRTP